MNTNLVMIRYRTSNNWSVEKVEARPSMSNAVEFLYNLIINTNKVGDITIEGVRYTTTEIIDIYRVEQATNDAMLIN